MEPFEQSSDAPKDNSARRIIALFGGVRPMARRLSAAGRRVAPTTVQGWAERGVIPVRRQADVLAAAASAGIALAPGDFLSGLRTSVPERGGIAGQGGHGTALELLSVAQMGRADRLTIERGTTGEELMEAAGRGAAEAILARFAPTAVAVLCGPGNNGGDGFVIARHLTQAGWPVQLGLLGDAERLTGDAALNASRWRETPGAGAIHPLTTGILDGAGLVVDALFGAGLARPLDGAAREVIDVVAGLGLDCVAIDMPSGVDGDSGCVRGAAVAARLTVTFFRKKPGHLLLPGRELVGEVRVIDIGIRPAVLGEIGPDTFENGPALWGDALPRSGSMDHKYSRGHLVIGGGATMTGAARLAACAAQRIGAGLVTVVSAPTAVPIYAADLRSVLVHPIAARHDFADYIADPRRRVVLLGPGYGVGRRCREHVMTALALGKRVCLDADAITSFADGPDALFDAIAANVAGGGGVVLTPHEGEFNRMFGADGGEGKLARARAAAARSGAVVLFKGADTVIARPDGQAVINSGAPPSLATGGTGDVLAGLIAGLLAQGMEADLAVAAGAWIHGAAARAFGPGLIADDLADLVPGVLSEISG